MSACCICTIMHEEVAASETNAEIRVLRTVGVTSAICVEGGEDRNERA